MKLSNFKAAALKKIMTLLVKNTEFFKHLCKNEQQTIFFCKALFHLYHQFGDSLKASLFFTIVRKLEDRNFESYEIFACFYKNLIKTLNTGNDRFAHKIMSEFFIEKHLASNELCKELIKIVKG